MSGVEEWTQWLMALVSRPIQICVCVCTTVTLWDVTGTASGDCGCPLLSSNVCCQTQVQENCHLCPTLSAPLTVPPSDFDVAAETRGSSTTRPEWLSPTLHRWNLTKHFSLDYKFPYLDRGRFVRTWCILLTIWGSNKIQPLSCFTNGAVVHLCTHCFFSVDD